MSGVIKENKKLESQHGQYSLLPSRHTLHPSLPCFFPQPTHLCWWYYLGSLEPWSLHRFIMVDTGRRWRMGEGRGHGIHPSASFPNEQKLVRAYVLFPKVAIHITWTLSQDCNFPQLLLTTTSLCPFKSRFSLFHQRMLDRSLLVSFQPTDIIANCPLITFFFYLPLWIWHPFAT